MTFGTIRSWFRENDQPWLLLGKILLWRLRRGLVWLIGLGILGLLVWAFVLALGAPANERAFIIATIGTGLALLSVAWLGYRLERTRHRQSKEPILGVIWKEPGMYPFSDLPAHEAKDACVEHVFWNAGESTILVMQPALMITRHWQTRSGANVRNEVLRSAGSDWKPEPAFPILLAKGEVAVWRYYPGDVQTLGPGLSQIVDRDGHRAVRFLEKQPQDQKLLFEIVHYSAVPADVQKSDLRRCYVGFAYDAPEKEKDGAHGK